MKIYLIREGDKFRPVSEEDLQNLKRVKEGQIIYVDYKKPRNPLFHNKFMSMVRVVYSNQEKYTDIVHVLNAFKIGTGHYSVMYLEGGIEVRIPNSISFAAMDEIAFNEFYDKAVEFALTEFLPTVSRSELDEYVNQVASYAG